jgi:hypothetical protein
MAFRAKKGSAEADGVAIKPVLLAVVLALLWVAFAPEQGDVFGMPEWGMPVILATRFLVGFVAGWLVISVIQIVLRLAWLGASQLWRDEG